MELSSDINETHENQDSRKISILRIIFLALENWTVCCQSLDTYSLIRGADGPQHVCPSHVV